VFTAAFGVIVQDKGFAAQMELGRLTALADEEKKTIEKAEEELQRFRDLPLRGTTGAEERIGYLLRKIQKSQKAVDGYEGEMNTLKKTLQSEV
jgi:hypothetical protein